MVPNEFSLHPEGRGDERESSLYVVKVEKRNSKEDYLISSKRIRGKE